MTGTERKVFQKYYPPDFDPRKIPKAKCPRNRQFVQRVMTCFNMQCDTCGEYIYKGKKFNMRRETAEGETYLGLKIFRFYFRCPNCLAEITFKTDLENCDYKQEHGATRLFEAHKLLQQQAKAAEKKDEEEKANPMAMLEKRTKMSRAEMEALGKLEELRELNRRHAAVDYERMLTDYRLSEEDALRRQERDDELFVQSLFGADGEVKVKRIVEEDDDDEVDEKPSVSALAAVVGGATRLPDDFADEKPPPPNAKMPVKRAAGKLSSQRQLLKGVIVGKKRKDCASSSDQGPSNDKPTAETATPNALNLLGSYAGSSGSDTD